MTWTVRARLWMAIGALCIGLAASGPAQASLARKAAGPKNIGKAGGFTVDTAGQVEGDADGKALTLEASAQYQISDRLQLLVEAIPLESQQPNAGRSVRGVGDTDVTLSQLVGGGSGAWPLIVLGARAKLPTARRNEMGTGKADYSALLILSRELGELELNVESEFASFGQPGGERLRNQFIYTLDAEYSVNDFLSVYAELFGNSAPSAVESRTDAARLGLEMDIPVSEAVAPYLSFEFDTEGVGSARAGIEWTW